jgi:hypothetical protein
MTLTYFSLLHRIEGPTASYYIVLAKHDTLPLSTHHGHLYDDHPTFTIALPRVSSSGVREQYFYVGV